LTGRRRRAAPIFRPTVEALETRAVPTLLPSIWNATAQELLSGSVLHGPVVGSSIKSSATATPAAAIDAFATALYAQLASQGGNLAFSPLSIETALAMVYAGARGQTADEMAAVLHLGPDKAATHTAFGNLIQQIAADGNASGSELNLADALWGQAGYPFAPAFLQLLQEAYGANLNSADFKGATEQARDAINAWVAQQTHGKIQDLFPPGSLTPYTRLVLANAVYFKGDWAQAFDPSETRDGVFHVAPGQTVVAPLMNQTGMFGYAARNGVQTLEMAYAGSHLVMDVLLPDQANGLAALERQLTPANLATWTSGLSQQRVAVTLPRFQTTDTFSLNQVLSAMGMPTAFNRRTANFSGMNNGSDKLYISAALHKAYVAVSEQGTEAAAATGVAVTVTAVVMPIVQPVVFRADHPFVYVIRDTSTNTVLFLGRISNPGSTS
jgi:serpin B